MRIRIIRIIIILLFLLIAADLVYVQAILGHHYYNLSKNNRIRIVPLPAVRGRIMDRKGRLLADNVTSYNITVTPQDIKDVKKLFNFLSKVLRVDKKVLMHRYRMGKFAPFAPVVVAEHITREQAIVIEENKYLYPSVMIQESFMRRYPLGSNGAHLLGYVGKPNRYRIEKLKSYGYTPLGEVGYLGVEEYYDAYLRGEPGGLQIEVNNKGQQVRLLGIKEPRKGKDITLTIDSDIQQIAQDVLNGYVGAIVIMDKKNGEILAMASSPGYDANIFVNRGQHEKELSRLFSDPLSPLLNRAIKGVFSPGSVFKPVVAIAALDNHKITKHTRFNCKGFLEIGGRKFRCAHIHGWQDLVQSLCHSCNVYYYHVGMILGADIITKYAKIFGLGSLTHIDLPYEEKGFVPSRRKRMLSGRRWFIGDTLNFSIGQGDLLCTPLQLVRMMGIIATDGYELQPHVIKAIAGKAVDRYSFRRHIKIDKSIFSIVKEGLRDVVSYASGTAHVMDIDGLYVAGKTGTVQCSAHKKDHAWFVGYTEGRKRDIVFSIFLEHGGSSQNACLVGRQLLLKLMRNSLL